ncbi:UNVERIFIED_CONTAM: Retrovirus-related Pol polyprotein from transposon RE1 [Sesamum calycinum]|uniref:Retrovirus-related Pol polyprotein from transposon RE1 n=1 Tax=Sesamum calycinum TaxID=2727403 RepID=A0AAW2NGM7_9LAMI
MKQELDALEKMILERHKAHLVAKWYNQIEGVDYIDRFSLLVKSPHDHRMFIQYTSASLLVVLVYVDNVMHTYPSESHVAQVKHFLDSEFTIKDLGVAKYYLGLEITISTLTFNIPSHFIDPEPYRRLAGRFLYLSFTKSDISFGAQQLSQFVHKPEQIHMTAALHLDLHVTILTPIPVFCDNQAAIHIIANLVFHETHQALEN